MITIKQPLDYCKVTLCNNNFTVYGLPRHFIPRNGEVSSRLWKAIVAQTAPWSKYFPCQNDTIDHHRQMNNNMSDTRIFQAAALASGQTLTLDPQASHHLARVMRAQAGEHIIIFNGQGGEFTARICTIGKRAITVMIGNYRAQAIESPCKIHLGQAISKSASMDLIIQKAVELGVHSITPVISQRCSIKTNSLVLDKRRQHWQAIAINACEQCGRNTIPTINTAITLTTYLQQANADTKLILDPAGKRSLNAAPTTATSLDYLVGPEGGFSPTEIQLACQYGCIAISLGPRTLRCETAALTALSLFQYRWGDLSGTHA